MMITFGVHAANMSTFIKIFLLLCLLPVQIYSQKKLDLVQIETQYGEILVWLSDETPEYKASFIQLTKDGYFDSLTFNRVIPDFVIQGGCPDTEEGFKDSAWLLPPHFVPGLKNTYGAFAAGRDDNPGMYSARCQFYIVQDKNGLPRLDGKYTVYGRVLKGMDVVDKIANVARDSKDEPLEKIPLHIKIIKRTRNNLKKMGVKIPSVTGAGNAGSF